MLLSVGLRDLLLASWQADPLQIARTLPPGLEPVPIEGRMLVTLAALRYTGGRLGSLPVPAFAQLNIRTYVEHEGEPAVFFLAARVTGAGMAGALMGAPYRPARIRVRPGSVRAAGLGVSLAYEVGREAAAGELTRHSLGLFEAAGLRAFRVRRGDAEWRRAAPVGAVRADPLVALGFEPAGAPDLLYAARAAFELEVPPRRLR